jgi:type IX secretion system PorP/SprF family membrane protein
MTLGRGKLALGLKGGIGTGKMDPVDLGDDIVFDQNTRNYVLPNFGLGVYYYTGKFHAGVSVPLLFGYKSNANGDIVAYHDMKNYAYYLTAGYTLGLSPEWQLKPSVLLEYDRAGGIITDAGLTLCYKNILNAGASYRFKQAIIMLIDIQVNNQLKVGVAYDYGLNDLNNYNRSSLEIALEYNLGYRVKAADPTKF